MLVLCLVFKVFSAVYKVCLYSSGCVHFGLSEILYIKQHCSCNGLICGFPLWASLCVCFEQRTIVYLQYIPAFHTLWSNGALRHAASKRVLIMNLRWCGSLVSFSRCCPFSGRWYFKIFKFKMSRFLSCHGYQRKSYKNVMCFLDGEASLLYCRSHTCGLSIDIKYNNLGIKEL